MRDYLPLIRKESSTHMDGLTVYVKEGLGFAWDLSLENSAVSYLCFSLALLHSVSYFFFLYQSPFFCLCAWFLILFHQHIGWSKKAPYFVFHPKVVFYNFFSMVLRWCTQQACEILLTPIWIQMNDLLCSSS